MANNIRVGQQFVTALQSASFTTIGLNASNTNIVNGYNDAGAAISWKPGRLINGLTTITINKGYLINSKAVLDKTAFFAPPIPAGGSGPEGPGIITLF